MMMVRVIVGIGVRMDMIVRVVMIVGVRVTEDVLMGVIVAVMMRAVLVMFEDRLHTGSDGDIRLRLRIELPAEEKHQGRSEEREHRDQPNLV
jgi:hypothetical protein